MEEPLFRRNVANRTAQLAREALVIQILIYRQKQIEHLFGPADRVEGFETQKLTAQGKKEKTIADNEEIELHEREKFRTVPNNGGPGATF